MAIAKTRGSVSRVYRKAIFAHKSREENSERGGTLAFMSDKVTAISLSVLCDTIDATNLREELVTGNEGTNGEGLTQIKADEKYNT